MNNITETTKSRDGKLISIGIIIFIFILMIIYIIVMFELYKRDLFIFAPYTPPTPKTKHFYPLGSVTKMTQEEIERRNEVIRASVKASAS